MKQVVRMFTSICLFAALLSTTNTRTQAQQLPASPKLSYEEEITVWHQQRIAGLKQPQSWLSLIALNWLEEGDNLVAGFGVVALNKGKTSFRSFPDVQTRLRGEVFTAGTLRTDVDKIEVKSKAFVVIRRGERYAVRIWDANAEALKTFTDIDCFPVSNSWKLKARWEAYTPSKPVKIQSVVPGYVETYFVPGAAFFTIGDKEYRLEPVTEKGSLELFFIFGDRTNGHDTYGGGRFLYTDPPKDGMVDLDFNKAINPPCAFSPYATCPLPPASNRLSVRIEAGEKNFGDH